MKPRTKPKTVRKSRFSNYVQASEREFRRNVYPDGTPLTKNQVAMRDVLKELKKITTR